MSIAFILESCNFFFFIWADLWVSNTWATIAYTQGTVGLGRILVKWKKCRFFLSRQSLLFHFCFLFLYWQSLTQQTDRLTLTPTGRRLRGIPCQSCPLGSTTHLSQQEMCRSTSPYYFCCNEEYSCGWGPCYLLFLSRSVHLLWFNLEWKMPSLSTHFGQALLQSFGLCLQSNCWNHSYFPNLLLKATIGSHLWQYYFQVCDMPYLHSVSSMAIPPH